MIVVIESEWRETPMSCDCGVIMYSDGKHLPQCPNCLEIATLEQVLEYLMTVRDQEYQEFGRILEDKA